MDAPPGRRLPVVLLVIAVGCGGTRPVVRLEAPPPAPPPLEVQPRPGQIWVQGHWHQVGGDWQWNDGYWVAQRPGYQWVDGAWLDAGGYWRWHSGHWAPISDSLDERPTL